MVEVGAEAPSVPFTGLDGTSASVPELLVSGPVALAFFKVSCPVCQLAFPYLERIHESGKGVKLIGVSQDDASSTRQFLDRFSITFPTRLDLRDTGYTASNAFGITHVPSVFVIEPGGHVSHSWSGFSKKDMEDLAARAGMAKLFQSHEYVPDFKAG